MVNKILISEEHVYTPQVIILPKPEDVDKYVASQLITQLQQQPNSVLTLPTGATPQGTYQRLVKAYQAREVDFSQVTTLNLDEYWPISKSHSSSYSYYMNVTLFNYVNIPEQQRYIPNGEAPDAALEAAQYEALLQQYTVDIGFITLGPGKTCHIGFNERGSTLDSRARYVRLDDETKQANVRFFDNPQDMPQGAITQGAADILEAKHILFVAKGEQKAWGVNRTLNGPIGPDAPATFLRYHPHVTAIVDQSAAGLLRK